MSIQPYNKERTDNAISFFASEYKKKTRNYLFQTQLYKFLAFFDFIGQERFGIPPLNLQYKAMEWGPVPIDIYKNRLNLDTSLYVFTVIDKNDDDKKEKIQVYPKGKPDLSYFSRQELNLMNHLLEIYADIFVKCGDMSDASHEEIKAWKKTWKTNPNGMIDYDLTFNDDLLEKNDDDLSAQEESYLIYKALQTQ